MPVTSAVEDLRLGRVWRCDNAHVERVIFRRRGRLLLGERRSRERKRNQRNEYQQPESMHHLFLLAVERGDTSVRSLVFVVVGGRRIAMGSGLVRFFARAR